MDQILQAIKCVNCRNVMKSAVSLPCGCSICLEHTHNLKGTSILCCKCEIDHPLTFSYGPFRPNPALTQIINTQINKMGELFGQNHKKAKQSCSRLDELLTQIEHLLKDPFNFIYEAIEHLKNLAQLKVEEKKLTIGEDEFTKLDEFKKNCKANLNSSVYLGRSQNLERKIKAARQELEMWVVTLNELKINQPAWILIESQSEMAIKSLERELFAFKNENLLRKRFKVYRAEVEKIIGRLEIDSRFRYLALNEIFKKKLTIVNIIIFWTMAKT